MNEKKEQLALFGDLTLKELTVVIQGLLQDALDVASASRVSKLKKSVNSFNMPLARDLLLSWVSRAMEVRAQLLFWMETNAFASGQVVRTTGMAFTHGSVLAMELIEYASLTIQYTELLKELITDTSSPDLPETFK